MPQWGCGMRGFCSHSWHGAPASHLLIWEKLLRFPPLEDARCPPQSLRNREYGWAHCWSLLQGWKRHLFAKSSSFPVWSFLPLCPCSSCYHTLPPVFRGSCPHSPQTSWSSLEHGHERDDDVRGWGLHACVRNLFTAHQHSFHNSPRPPIQSKYVC